MIFRHYEGFGGGFFNKTLGDLPEMFNGLTYGNFIYFFALIFTIHFLVHSIQFITGDRNRNPISLFWNDQSSRPYLDNIFVKLVIINVVYFFVLSPVPVVQMTPVVSYGVSSSGEGSDQNDKRIIGWIVNEFKSDVDGEGSLLHIPAIVAMPVGIVEELFYGFPDVMSAIEEDTDQPIRFGINDNKYKLKADGDLTLTKCLDLDAAKAEELSDSIYARIEDKNITTDCAALAADGLSSSFVGWFPLIGGEVFADFFEPVDKLSELRHADKALDYLALTPFQEEKLKWMFGIAYEMIKAETNQSIVSIQETYRHTQQVVIPSKIKALYFAYRNLRDKENFGGMARVGIFLDFFAMRLYPEKGDQYVYATENDNISSYNSSLSTADGNYGSTASPQLLDIIKADSYPRATKLKADDTSAKGNSAYIYFANMPDDVWDFLNDMTLEDIEAYYKDLQEVVPIALPTDLAAFGVPFLNQSVTETSDANFTNFYNNEKAIVYLQQKLYKQMVVVSYLNYLEESLITFMRQGLDIDVSNLQDILDLKLKGDENDLITKGVNNLSKLIVHGYTGDRTKQQSFFGWALDQRAGASENKDVKLNYVNLLKDNGSPTVTTGISNLHYQESNRTVVFNRSILFAYEAPSDVLDYTISDIENSVDLTYNDLDDNKYLILSEYLKAYTKEDNRLLNDLATIKASVPYFKNQTVVSEKQKFALSDIDVKDSYQCHTQIEDYLNRLEVNIQNPTLATTAFTTLDQAFAFLNPHLGVSHIGESTVRDVAKNIAKMYAYFKANKVQMKTAFEYAFIYKNPHLFKCDPAGDADTLLFKDVFVNKILANSKVTDVYTDTFPTDTLSAQLEALTTIVASVNDSSYQERMAGIIADFSKIQARLRGLPKKGMDTSPGILAFIEELFSSASEGNDTVSQIAYEQAMQSFPQEYVASDNSPYYELFREINYIISLDSLIKHSLNDGYFKDLNDYIANWVRKLQNVALVQGYAHTMLGKSLLNENLVAGKTVISFPVTSAVSTQSLNDADSDGGLSKKLKAQVDFTENTDEQGWISFAVIFIFGAISLFIILAISAIAFIVLAMNMVGFFLAIVGTPFWLIDRVIFFGRDNGLFDSNRLIKNILILLSFWMVFIAELIFIVWFFENVILEIVQELSMQMTIETLFKEDNYANIKFMLMVYILPSILYITVMFFVIYRTFLYALSLLASNTLVEIKSKLEEARNKVNQFKRSAGSK